MNLDAEISSTALNAGGAGHRDVEKTRRLAPLASTPASLNPLFAAWKVYLFLVVPAVILLNLAFPNFHAPDDYDHLKRGYTLFHHPFQMITPAGGSTGAMIDSGLVQYIDSQIPIVKFDGPLRANERAAYLANDRIRWTGKPTFSEMPGSLNYFPLLYAPQGVMLELGRFFGASVKVSVLWARLANSLVGIFLAALGLYLLPSGRSLALLMLLLPRTLMQFASNSADPILYGLTLIIVALPIRFSNPKAIKSGYMAAAIFISASVRPTIAALTLTGGVEALRKRQWWNVAAIVGGCAAAALWVLITLPSVSDLRFHAGGSVTQKLVAFASNWPLLVGRTLSDRANYFYASFVGHYVWGNPPTYLGLAMPGWIYATALLLLAFAVWQDLATPASLPSSVRLSLVLGAGCSILLTFLAMYIGCTAANDTIITGIQGRYFVPPLFAIGAAIGGLAAGRARSYPALFSRLVIAWVAACTTAMLVNSTQLYSI